MAESEEELNCLLMWVKDESENAGLKLNIQKTKIMASSSITSWKIEGEKVEAMTDFLFLGSKISADSDCSYEIMMLAPWNESYDKTRQHILKSIDITLPTKVHILKTMVFSVVRYRCESWTIKKAEC